MPGFVSRIVAADVRLYFMDTALGFIVAGFNQVRAHRQAFFCLGVDPEPAEPIHTGKQVLSSELPPSFKITIRGFKVPAELSAAVAAGKA